MDKTGKARGGILANRETRSCCLLSQLWRQVPSVAGQWRSG